MLRSRIVKTPAPRWRAFAVCAVTLGSALAGASRISAHGNVDQALQANAGCNVLNFTASVTQGGGQRQEFVPSQPALVAVDVCVLAEAGPTEVDVRIRSGTAAAPGGVIGGGSVVANILAYEHVDFAAPIQVTPGQPYVIELATANGLAVTWLGNPSDIDLYASGSSNEPAAVSDFAFRTYAGTLPATATAPPTKTAQPTKTRTPTGTGTVIATLTPAPTQTATRLIPPASQTPPAQATVAAATPPPPENASASTPTRVSGVLGGARRVGVIKPPDVGGGYAARRSRTALVAGALLHAAGAVALASGLAFRRRPASRRRRRGL
jgi:hypothetical protein